MDKAKDFDIAIENFMPYLEHKRDDMVDGYIGNVGYSTMATKERMNKDSLSSATKMVVFIHLTKKY